jgi:hypothetical protein
MARKGWDALSDAYRRRLQRQGISEQAYTSGQSLHAARGHVSAQQESLRKRITRFVTSFGVPEEDDRFNPHGYTIQDEIERLRSMNPQQVQDYMDYRRQMTRYWEGGKPDKAMTMFKRRDRSLNVPEFMWWYHGMFGG